MILFVTVRSFAIDRCSVQIQGRFIADATFLLVLSRRLRLRFEEEIAGKGDVEDLFEIQDQIRMGFVPVVTIRFQAFIERSHLQGWTVKSNRRERRGIEWIDLEVLLQDESEQCAISLEFAREHDH